ncbi:MAG: hypothetical protein ACLQQM_05530 [Acidimicrobiales bacterium]
MGLRRVIAGRGAGNRPRRSSPEALANEREFLRQSIEDLEEQRAAGEVDEDDFAVLDSRYGRRLAEVEAAIGEQAAAQLAAADLMAAQQAAAQLAAADLVAAQLEAADLAAADLVAAEQAGTAADLLAARQSGAAADAEVPVAVAVRVGPVGGASPVPPASPARRLRRLFGSRRARLVIGIAAAVCFVAAATVLVASLAGVRLPGESATGSVSLSSAQQEQETLDQAAILGSEGRVADAVQLYNQVLQTDPNQPDALTYGGWLVRLAGLSSKNRLVLARGDASVARAVKVAPGYPDGHALLGVILYEDFARPEAASVQFRDALGAGASKSLLMSVAAVAAKAFAAAKEPLPPRYSAAMKSVAAG